MIMKRERKSERKRKRESERERERKRESRRQETKKGDIEKKLVPKKRVRMIDKKK